MIHFIVHDKGDSVGVVVTEGVKAGQELTGWIMEENETVRARVVDPIPIGHKFALKDLPNDAAVIKYGVDIGRTVAPIRTGQHVHVHNLKTRRW
ncbi:flagellar protein FlgA [Sulfurifustis variabilis]|uniref:Flagellar protein FlgA n=1 Tax=Sulfurifustis variabilis TaxID=1675686 RepID=A0A1B4V728_9GAMM|nr:UxaA family hydrolase [Sulfurifustis variabilis]BAU48402.1 flagellar protein FlgA [Sulfurifustis variabilis]